MFCFDSILFQTIVAAAIHKCPENLLVWQKIQVKQIKGYTFCINMSFTAKFLGEYLIKDVSLLTKQIISFFSSSEKTRVRNLSESSEGGDTRGDAQAAGTGYDVDGKFSYFTVSFRRRNVLGFRMYVLNYYVSGSD